MLRSVINRVFAYEHIDGCGVNDYLHRWRLLAGPAGRALYLHRYVGSDWASRVLHDHPKTFLSIGLWGGYVEEFAVWCEQPPTTINGRLVRRYALIWERNERRQFRAPWIRTFPPEHMHRLRVTKRGCWTLVYVGPHVKDWYFWPKRMRTPAHRYIAENGDC